MKGAGTRLAVMLVLVLLSLGAGVMGSNASNPTTQLLWHLGGLVSVLAAACILVWGVVVGIDRRSRDRRP